VKYFICALDKTNIGIPARQTERIISAEGAREKEDGEKIISLPELFQLKNCETPHAVILKRDNGNAYNSKILLLTPRIDAELEIPEDEIRGLPNAMAGVYRHFTGAYCCDTKVILILNPEKIAETLK